MARAIVGSINLTSGSFDSRRELAIELQDGHIIERFARVVRQPWEHSHRLDLETFPALPAMPLAR
jgi:cardiolipin synthase